MLVSRNYAYKMKQMQGELQVNWHLVGLQYRMWYDSLYRTLSMPTVPDVIR